MAYGIKDFKELIVWQRAVELVEEVYRVTGLFPKDEIYGLTSQMRRCAVSIPSNIAEGKKRGSLKDYVHFLRVADGSAAEMETQVVIAKRLYPEHDFEKAEVLLVEIQKMLTKMIEKLGEKRKDLEQRR